MTWAQRLNRVFKLDLSSCETCGGQVRAIASVEDPLVIGKILAHLEARRPMLVGEGCRPEVRGSAAGRSGAGLDRAHTAPVIRLGTTARPRMAPGGALFNLCPCGRT